MNNEETQTGSNEIRGNLLKIKSIKYACPDPKCDKTFKSERLRNNHYSLCHDKKKQDGPVPEGCLKLRSRLVRNINKKSDTDIRKKIKKIKRKFKRIKSNINSEFNVASESNVTSKSFLNNYYACPNTNCPRYFRERNDLIFHFKSHFKQNLKAYLKKVSGKRCFYEI